MNLVNRNPSNSKQKDERGLSLFFVFYGRHRPWSTLQCIEPPAGSIYEARAYPSLEYAIGETWEDAKANLQDLLDRELSGAKVDPQAWYTLKLQELSKQDLATLHASAFKVVTGELPEHEITLGKLDSSFVEEVEELERGNQEMGVPCIGRT